MTQPTTILVTYLTDAVEVRPEERGGLRVGHLVQLRPRAEGPIVEAWSPQLGRLGRLPPAEGEALAPLLRTGVSGLTAKVSALIPRAGRVGGTRIHIRVAGAEAVAPAPHVDARVRG